MPPNNQSAEKALACVRTAARRNRAAAGTPDAAAARKALRYAVAAAANCGIKQTLIAKAAGLSKAQVSRVARGASSGKTTLPPATYLVDTLPSDEIVERYRSGETTYDLSRAYKCSNTTIINILKRNGVARRSDRTIHLPVSNEYLAHRYLHDRAEIQHLAAELGVKPNLVSRRLADAGVAVPVGHRRMDLPDSEIVKRYQRGESIAEIARSYGVSFPTIRRRIPKERSAGPGAFPPPNPSDRR
jgi:Mor family transcriptional regulator